MNKGLGFLLLLLLLPVLACNLQQASQPALSFPEMTSAAAATDPSAIITVTDPFPTIPATSVQASPQPQTSTPAPTLASGTSAVVATRQAAARTATAYRTRTISPSSTNRPATATPKPICSVLKNVRLRQLPSIDAIWIRTLLAGEVLIPLQYIPIGQSGGEWLKVQVQETQEIGWVTADPQVIGCNMDISQLK